MDLSSLGGLGGGGGGGKLASSQASSTATIYGRDNNSSQAGLIALAIGAALLFGLVLWLAKKK